MDSHTRDRFDRLLEEVLAELPPEIHELIEEVPLHVEDYPSQEVLAQTGIWRRDGLCGLYTGVPLGEKSVERSNLLPDVVTIYREGILAAARDARGHIGRERLRREIRITILHELGHHHGLEEDDLDDLGYG